MGYFLPYQQRWINDESPIKIYEKSRRIGITYATSYRAVRKCLMEKEGSTFIQWVSSRDELTAKEFVTDYVAKWCKEANAVAKGLKGDNVEVVDEKHSITAFVVKFKNGSRICSLSSNPMAFAGKGGDILLDEMDLHENQETLYAMAFPCITWGNQLEIVSAYDPEGSEDTLFARLNKEAAGDNPKGMSRHRTTLEDAINEGFVEKVNEVLFSKGRPQQSREEFRNRLRNGCVSRSAFESQYMCVPNEAKGMALLESSDLASACLALDMYRGHFIEKVPEELLEKEFYIQLFAGKRVAFGYDIGRTGDLSSIWLNALAGESAALCGLITLSKMRFEIQKRIVSAILDAGASGCGDKTGLGMAICEELQERYSGSFLGLNFAAEKMNLGTLLQNTFEQGKQVIPLQCPEVKADLAAIKKDVTTSGRIILTAGRNELLKESHCDIAWSNALALYAAVEFCGGPCMMEPAIRAKEDEFNQAERVIYEMDQKEWL